MTTYFAYQCRPCLGRGSKVDATMADSIGGSASGRVTCSRCSGQGYLRVLSSTVIATSGYWAVAGDRVPERDLTF